MPRALRLTFVLFLVLPWLAGCGDYTAESRAASSEATVLSGTQRTFKVIDLGTLGGQVSDARAINDKNQVIGTAMTPDGQYHPFLWDNGVMTAFDQLACSTCLPTGINSKGQIVGTYATSAGPHAFIWKNGSVTDLGTLGGASSSAVAINDRGEVTGTAETAVTGVYHLFTWRDGVMEDLGPGDPHAISNKGWIVGSTSADAAIWRHGILRSIGTLGGNSAQALGVNEWGQVVGTSRIGLTLERHAFLWQDGAMMDLGTLGGTVGFAEGINDDGQIAGISTTPDGLDHVFLWHDGSMWDLGRGVAFGINSKGVIVGRIPVADGVDHAAIWKPR